MITNKQKIIPHLWFDKEAEKAAGFYTSIFPESEITSITKIRNTPSGDTNSVSFKIRGHSFVAISAGPLFKLNPSISFFVNFDPLKDRHARERIDMVWNELIKGGKALMSLDKYSFSERYGWVQDRYGVSWQLILTDPESEERPFVIPSFLFAGELCGKAEEATNFYISIFKDSKRGEIVRYPAGMTPDKEGTVMFTDFELLGQWFAAMDSAKQHGFSFNEAVSLMVLCDTQEEIDFYWEKLSAVPEAEQCGWLKDKYNVSWQIVPSSFEDMMANGTREQMDRVTEAFLKMKKFEIVKLQKAYEGD
ncbi:MAG TPA: VOC family protein [Chitinispirillaceae bacterium]|nr:VOC family protein [Chitinispirillaceae bacterium]